jgi:homoserine O-acetyltransferase/O-succinyltransferase
MYGTDLKETTMLNKWLRYQARCRFLAVLACAAVIVVSGAHGADDFEVFKLGDFALENGKTLPDSKLTYATRGKLNDAKDNAILAPSHYAADHHGYDYLTGPGKALDTDRYFIIATNMFANGISSSPNNTPAPFDGPRFPSITIRDNVRATHELVVKQFGIKRLKAVVGFSMGGQQAYQWALSYPDGVDRIVVICSHAKQYPFGYARLAGAIGAIKGDSAWNGGEYKMPPANGLRALGLHWAAWLFSSEWWRRETYITARGLTLDQQIKSSEDSFVGADANNLLSQAMTWQAHDISSSPGLGGDLRKALRSINCKTLLMPSTSDQYFPAVDSEEESKYIKDVVFEPVQTIWGHPGGGGSDEKATQFLDAKISKFLSEP